MGKLSQVVGALNDADELRRLIDDSEKALARLDSQSARRLMTENERAHQLLETLTEAGGDFRAEAARLDAIDNRIVQGARTIVRALGGKEALIQLRQQTAPDTSAQWWLLDRVLEQTTHRLLNRIAIIGGVIAVVAIVAYLTRSIYLPIILPPDPVGDAVNTADQALAQNNVQAADNAINAGLSKVPTSTELLIWKGILQARNNDRVAAAESFTAAMSTATDKEFYILRAITYARLGAYPEVITDTTIIIQKYPDDPDAYYIRATGYEGLSQQAEALADLQKCSDLATASGNDTLVAQARMRMAILMQQVR